MGIRHFFLPSAALSKPSVFRFAVDCCRIRSHFAHCQVIKSKITQPFKKETACQGRAALITRCSSALPEAESLGWLRPPEPTHPDLDTVDTWREGVAIGVATRRSEETGCRFRDLAPVFQLFLNLAVGFQRLE